jgi:hypothetical protein
MLLEGCWEVLDVAGRMLDAAGNMQVERWKAAGRVLEDYWQDAGNNVIKEHILSEHSTVAPRSVLSNF